MHITVEPGIFDADREVDLDPFDEYDVYAPLGYPVLLEMPDTDRYERYDCD